MGELADHEIGSELEENIPLSQEQLFVLGVHLASTYFCKF